MEGGRGELSCFVAPAREGWDGVGKERGSKKDYYGRENETLGASSPSPSSPFFFGVLFLGALFCPDPPAIMKVAAWSRCSRRAVVGRVTRRRATMTTCAERRGGAFVRRGMIPSAEFHPKGSFLVWSCCYYICIMTQAFFVFFFPYFFVFLCGRLSGKRTLIKSCISFSSSFYFGLCCGKVA